ncbi:MAG: pyrimidine 5'-nucleotidase [Betaproteobacteria bacterium]|nr:pyrimidine 5'-nucleotidase [Betaproteobacteria bacterium]
MSQAGRRVWLFDLDNTLHDADPHIFPHINRAMTAYVAQQAGLGEAEASVLRETYWRRYGATLLGLMRHHGTDPLHFLHHTHQFDNLSGMVVYDRALRQTLRRLPGAKIVFSNAPRHYAEAVLDVMGVRQAFDDVCTIERMRFRPKPQIHGFLHLLRAHRLSPARCVLVEDSAENLKTARQLGMRTVWISRSSHRPAWVDLRLKSVLELPRRLGALE